MNFGVIIVGYPGIGKTTLSNLDYRFVDLESGSFFIGDKRSEDWYVTYCTVAVNLSEQGYAVFVSSHKQVREYLLSLPLPVNVKLLCCVPSIELKSSWVDKLWNRWRTTGLYKDFKAYSRAQDSFIHDIKEIKQSFNIICEITGMNYDLRNLLESSFKQHGIDYGIYNLC